MELSEVLHERPPGGPSRVVFEARGLLSGDSLQALVRRVAPARPAVVDLRGVCPEPGLGLAALLTLEGCAFVVSAELRLVFALLGLDRVLRVEDTIDAALAALGSSPSARPAPSRPSRDDAPRSPGAR